MESILVQCPHCRQDIIILELNCCIFRHAVFKNSMEQIGPHSSKEECEKYLRDDLVYGCAKPFKVINENNTYTAVACDYI